jgi:hypothetical protein
VSEESSSGGPATAVVELEGHIIDSLLLAKVLDEILAGGADYEIADVVIGRARTDHSRAVLSLTHPDGAAALDSLCAGLAVHGARRVDGRRASGPPEDDG